MSWERTIDLIEKRRMLIMAMISSLLLFSACSNKNIVTTTPSETDTSEESEKSLGEAYGFTSFDLAIDTKDMKNALIATYDEKRDKTEAVYENKIEDLYLHGNKAMDKLDTIFNEMSLEPDMDAEDLIKKASEAFEIIDYKSLKLTIKFKGHDTKELMMTK
jgi:hypothetical protein